MYGECLYSYTHFWKDMYVMLKPLAALGPLVENLISIVLLFPTIVSRPSRDCVQKDANRGELVDIPIETCESI